MLNFFYFKFYALSQKVNGMGRHNHYYACLTLSFFEIVAFVNGILLVHMLGRWELVFSGISKFLAVIVFLVVLLINYTLFSIRSRSEEFLVERKSILSNSSEYLGGIISLLLVILTLFFLAYFTFNG
ncbi:hypothetical protein [Microbulbifer sp. M83]|uniref:hypothetical protein n=1 Tax=Microbulbifer sp. M83 TaxID=3118246 RepID=UPI002FE11B87